VARRTVEHFALQQKFIPVDRLMPGGSLRRRALGIAAIVGATLACAFASANAEVSTEDLQAIARTLGFLETLPHDGTLAVRVVYAPAQPDAAAVANATAEKLNAIPGPNSATFKARSVPFAGLADDQDRFDVLILAPGTCSDAAAAQPVIDAVVRRRVVSVASDPACLDARCCVLMVRTGHKVEIVLDKALADSAGLRFSSVFAMMVKRK
jgi:YfiR/HmsC-like